VDHDDKTGLDAPTEERVSLQSHHHGGGVSNSLATFICPPTDQSIWTVGENRERPRASDRWSCIQTQLEYPFVPSVHR
jgi:hypothetical protein